MGSIFVMSWILYWNYYSISKWFSFLSLSSLKIIKAWTEPGQNLRWTLVLFSALCCIIEAANGSHLSCVWFGCPGPLFWASFIRLPNMQSVNGLFFYASHTLTTLIALQIWEMSCSDRMSRGTGCWSKKFLCNRSRSHTTFQLWVPLWASLRLFTAENANYSQMGDKNVIKRDKHLWFLFEGFEVSALVTLYQQFNIYMWLDVNNQMCSHSIYVHMLQNVELLQKLGLMM